MTPEDVKILNHNVQVQNTNDELFENITRGLIQTNDGIINALNDMVCYDFARTMVFLLIFIGILLEIQSLDNKVKKLERDKI
mgnify:CR=1 FL=1